MHIEDSFPVREEWTKEPDQYVSQQSDLEDMISIRSDDYLTMCTANSLSTNGTWALNPDQCIDQSDVEEVISINSDDSSNIDIENALAAEEGWDQEPEICFQMTRMEYERAEFRPTTDFKNYFPQIKEEFFESPKITIKDKEELIFPENSGIELEKKNFREKRKFKFLEAPDWRIDAHDVIEEGPFFDHEEKFLIEGGLNEKTKEFEFLEEANLHENVTENCIDMNITRFRPIQKVLVPLILEDKKDILVFARSGSGKTTSYLVPIVSESYKSSTKSRGAKRFPKILILVPDDATAQGVCDMAVKLAGKKNCSPIVTYATMNEGPNSNQMELLKHVGCDILIASTDRFMELLYKRSNYVLPFATAIPGGIFPGKAITVRGKTMESPDRFAIDLCCGLLVQGDHQDDKAIHINPRRVKKKGLFGSSDEDIVLNSMVNNKWGAEERYRNVIPEGGSFNIRILAVNSYFKVAVNGKHLADFVHRIPIEKITTIFIHGGAIIDVIEFEGTNPEPQVPPESDPGIPEGPPVSDIGEGTNLPTADVIIKKPTVPFVHSFRSGSLYPGKSITLVATPKMHATTFTLNVMRGGDHFFHLRVDFPNGNKGSPAVVRNNCLNKQWMTEERQISRFPFSQGITFDLQLNFEEDYLTVRLDGENFFNYVYRPKIMLEETNVITIQGDLTIQRFELKMIPEFPIPPGALTDLVETRIYSTYSTPREMIKALEPVSLDYEPRVICNDKTIGIEFPQGEFSGGRIFVSKHEDEPSCVRHISSREEKIHLELPFQLLPCGMKMQKLNYPTPGVEYSLKVVVSYDHSKMTEEDEMFLLSCRYFSKETTVGSFMEVSPFAKTYLIGDDMNPNCRYSLHMNSIDGPPPDNAVLGDKVYHVWKCDARSYAIKVYRCFVHDGAEKKYLLIDEQGCSRDTSILPELTYDSSLNLIYASSKVFKFTDSNKMYFNCLLYMCPKSDQKCRETVPPTCGNSGRKKRFSSLRNGMIQLTLNSSLPYRDFQDLSRDNIVLKDDPLDQEGPRSIYPTKIIQYKISNQRTCPEEKYNYVGFIVLIVCNVITLTTSTISICALYRRRFTAKLSISDKT
ncbi:hypothetical protein FO519_005148 [Halicephalobus sp. NKZ332]|nr:hypothetical protein FO519_005148 [Halicephalobus sp. NKZ332]